MPEQQSSEAMKAIAARLRFYRELGINDFYHREVLATSTAATPEIEDPMPKQQVAAVRSEAEPKASEPIAIAGGVSSLFDPTAQVLPASERPAAMKIIQQDIGTNCTRCRLGTQGRKQVVFGVGNLSADIMFVGEAPGADEDAQGEP